jgi:ABC-type lipoprotein release transport system permease subunit
VGVIGVIGGIALGVAIGHVLLEYINVLQTGWYLPYRPSWTAVAETATLVLVSATLAGWYPARHAAALGVAESLGYE